MKTKFYSFLAFAALLTFSTAAQTNLKSILGVEPMPLDSNSIIDITQDFVIADGNEDGDSPDMWRIGDGDPGKVWSITPDLYDSGRDSYYTALHGERKEGDDNNTNSFFLWSRTDSGVPWNVSSPLVTFTVKITDGDVYTRENNLGHLGIYFWVQIKDDDGYRKAKVRFTSDAEGLYTATNEWWSYTPYGLGNDLTDGQWHTYTVNLKDIIQQYRDWAYNDSGDPKAGHPFKFYGIIAIETRCLDAQFDDIIVKPETATAIKKRPVKQLVTVYPNPSEGNITITGVNNISDIGVYDLTGRKVMSVRNISSGSRLDLTGLEKGAYFIRIEDGENVSTKKIVITK